MRDVWARNEGAELQGLAVDGCRDGGETHIVQAPDVVAERPDGRVPQDQVVVGDVCALSEDLAAAHWAWIAHQVPACAVLCRIGLGEAVGGRDDGEVTGCAGGTVSENGGGGREERGGWKQGARTLESKGDSRRNGQSENEEVLHCSG